LATIFGLLHVEVLVLAEFMKKQWLTLGSKQTTRGTAARVASPAFGQVVKVRVNREVYRIVLRSIKPSTSPT